jgi:large subunit ribosomal protein L10
MPSFVKELMLKEVRQQFEANPYMVFANFQGLPVADLAELRRTLEKVSSRSMLVKHSFAKKVFAELNYAEADQFMDHHFFVAFAQKDPQNLSKAILQFAKTNNKLVPRGMVFEKKVYGPDFVKALATLPSRKELLTQVVIRIKSPITGLVLTLNALRRGLVVAINEVRKKKESAPAAS